MNNFRIKATVFCILTTFLLFRCDSNVDKLLEIINPPVNVKVVQKITPFTYYELSFDAFNDETNFAGYAIFAGVDLASAKTLSLAATTSEDAGIFCGPESASIDQRYIVQIGGASQADENVDCYESSLTINSTALTTGSGLAVRANVTRAIEPFSLPTSTVIP